MCFTVLQVSLQAACTSSKDSKVSLAASNSNSPSPPIPPLPVSSPPHHPQISTGQPMAYLFVQLRAVASYFCLSVLYMCAISGTKGSSGLGSVSNEQMERRT